ncbi:hypothetical protein GGE65_007726 [Skermanella aerolata]|uniref:hypothetical protein n=1 Tax=Skermanella aerolata TaxID=393310 RepID=UPI003D24FC28
MIELPVRDTNAAVEGADAVDVDAPADPDISTQAETSGSERTESTGIITVQCIVTTRPWHSTGFLSLGDTAELPARDAEIMISRDQVVRID